MLKKENTTTVLYIGGESRSGSTLLSAILGSCKDIVSVGEVRTVWRTLKTDQLCGCGEPISRCQFWTAVGSYAYGGWSSLDIDAMLEADRTTSRHRSIPRHIVLSTKGAASDLNMHRELLGKLYDGIREVSGSETIVDSTKDPSYAYVLRDVPGVDLRVINLVRDSRGVAYSNAKVQIIRPEVAHNAGTEPAYMPTWPLWRTAVSWDVKNLLFYLLIPASKRRLVKYESVVGHPGAELKRIREFAGSEWCDDDVWNDGTDSFEIFPHHTLGGNPVRFRRGHTRLEPDDEWKIKMSRGEKALVTAITLPLLAAYGYPVSAGRSNLGIGDSKPSPDD